MKLPFSQQQYLETFPTIFSDAFGSVLQRRKKVIYFCEVYRILYIMSVIWYTRIFTLYLPLLLVGIFQSRLDLVFFLYLKIWLTWSIHILWKMVFGDLVSYWPTTFITVQKVKFLIKDVFSKCDEIRRKLRIWSYILKKSLIENFIFCQCISQIFFKWKLTSLIEMAVHKFVRTMYSRKWLVSIKYHFKENSECLKDI